METDCKGVGRTENAKVVEIGHELATSESFFRHKSGATKAGIVFSVKYNDDALAKNKSSAVYAYACF